MKDTVIPAASLVTEVANLARRAAEASQSIHQHYGIRPFIVLTSADGAQTVTYIDPAQRPDHIEANAQLHDVDSFIAYVNRFRDPRTVIHANALDIAKVSFVASIDYHEGSEEGSAAEFNSHKATLALRATPDWTNWTNANRRGMSLEEFALFVAENGRNFVSPDAATMQELAEKFEAKKDAQFKQGVRLANGDRNIEWSETTTADAGKIKIPEKLALRIAPFHGSEPREFEAWFRYNLREGRLTITLALDRPDIAITNDVLAIVERIRTATEVPVFFGQLN